MIITRLTDGLGNQMFQYAVGRQLSERHRSVLKLDVSAFDGSSLRKYGLHALAIRECFAAPQEVQAIVKGRRLGLLRRAARRFFGLPLPNRRTHIAEAGTLFDPSVLNLPDGVYLQGYWQSERYFAEIRDILCTEFRVKTPLAGHNAKLAEAVSECNSVALHVRRSDYVTDPEANRRLGTCDIDYYARALAHVGDAVGNIHVFVFSDEPEWARRNLGLGVPTTFVDHNGLEDGHEDMRLMRLCKHAVTANSSFSWWAAWLNANPDKVVCAPRCWRRDEHPTRDIVPASWVLF